MSETLEQLLVRVRACRLCVTDPGGVQLPHEPRPILQVGASARVAVFSQAPGMRAHVSGIPFSDASGNRLRDWMGVTTLEFYDADRVAIVPMGFCFPGYGKAKDDLPPRRECAPLWRERVLAGLPHLQLVILVGAYAIRWHLPDRRRTLSMTEHVQAWPDLLDPATGPTMLTLPHPSWRNTAWLKAHPWFERDLVPVLRTRVRTALR